MVERGYESRAAAGAPPRSSQRLARARRCAAVPSVISLLERKRVELISDTRGVLGARDVYNVLCEPAVASGRQPVYARIDEEPWPRRAPPHRSKKNSTAAAAAGSSMCGDFGQCTKQYAA
jgi:hypothetical protein